MPLQLHRGIPCSDLSANAPDVPVLGWNASCEQYSFGYAAEQPPPQPLQSQNTCVSAVDAAGADGSLLLLLRVLLLGDTLLVTLAGSCAAAEPQVLEVRVADYSDAAGQESPPTSAVAGLKGIDALAARIQKALGALKTAAAAAAGGGGSKSAACQHGSTTCNSAAGSIASNQQQQQQQPAYRHGDNGDPLRIGPPRRPLRMGTPSAAAAAAASSFAH
jgi:hypothetical protein